MISPRIFIHYFICIVIAMILCSGLYAWAKHTWHFGGNGIMLSSILSIVAVLWLGNIRNKAIAPIRLYMGILASSIGGTLAIIALLLALH